MFERFTDRARRVLVLAQEEARLLHHNYIGTEHLLLGLVQEGDGVAARAINQLGISLEDVRVTVHEMVGTSGAAPTGSPPFTPRAKKVLELSLREALQLGHNYIGTEHILLGLVREGEGVAAQVFVSRNVDLARVRQQVVSQLSGYRPPEGSASTAPGDPVGKRRQGGFVECSFCGRRPPDTGRIVAGRGGAYVCEHCLSDLKETVTTDTDPSPESTSSPAVITGRTPRHEEEARTEIALAFGHALMLSEDRLTVPSVEGGELLGPCLKEAQVRYAALRRHHGSVTVDAIEFLDEAHAAVTFSMTLEGVASPARYGRALMVDSTWKVARSTFCDVMRWAGVECPAL